MKASLCHRAIGIFALAFALPCAPALAQPTSAEPAPTASTDGIATPPVARAPLPAEVVELREHLHAHPELSGEENDTSLHLYQRLAEHGLQVRIGPEGQGVIADLNWSGNGSKSPCIAIRADIDALPIQDQTDRPYRSQNPGVMHACGHDAHAARDEGEQVAVDRTKREARLQPTDRQECRRGEVFSLQPGAGYRSEGS